MQIAYLCDKKKKCADSATCGGDYCNRTFEPEHALNGICEDPEHDKRFRDIGNGYFEELLQQEEQTEK